MQTLLFLFLFIFLGFNSHSKATDDEKTNELWPYAKAPYMIDSDLSNNYTHIALRPHDTKETIAQ